MLPLSSRLRTREDFDETFHKGKPHFLGEVLVLMAEAEKMTGETTIGVAFKGKSFPKAHTRHLYKRKMLEALRPKLPFLPSGKKIVLLFQKPFSKTSFIFFEKKAEEIQKSLNKAKK